MTIGAIHQVVPTLRPWDAVGDHTRRLRDVLRAAGIDSDIFTDDVDDRLATEAKPISALPPEDPSRQAIIYQCSIGNEVVDTLLRRTDPLVVNYHNLTPPEQLLPWAPEMAHLVAWGRSQLRQLADRAVLGVGDSAFNTAELTKLRFERALTAPILLDPALMEPPGPDDDRDGSWLFVGRVVPNKAHHDLIAAFAWHRAHNDPDARLDLVGSVAVPAYRDALEELTGRLGLGGAVRFLGAVSPDQRDQLYRSAGVFVCLSEHEGFCIPLLEAMAHRLPIVAYAAGAVPETVGAAGLVLPTKSPSLVAAAAHRVVQDPALRGALVGAGAERIRSFHPDRVGEQHLAALRSALALTPPEDGSQGATG